MGWFIVIRLVKIAEILVLFRGYLNIYIVYGTNNPIMALCFHLE